MTEQYQDLYKHLSVGAASLCRPDSVAAVLADESKAQAQIGPATTPTSPSISPGKVASNPVAQSKAKDPVDKIDTKPVVKDSGKGSHTESVKDQSEAVTKKTTDNSKASSAAPN